MSPPCRWLAVLLLLATVAVHAEPLWVGRFDTPSDDPPAPWRLLRFDERIPPTRYRISRWDGVVAIEASAAASMALLARPISVDLVKTPVLCWRWRIDASLKTADIDTKRGDDYAARLYVSFAIPAAELGLATRAKLRIGRLIWGDQLPDAAINYVWDNRSPVGTRRPNAYTNRARMIVARSGDREAGRWVEERHAVREDVVQAFGSPSARATLLAVAADTDNTGETARAGFADLHFVGSDEACHF